MSACKLMAAALVAAVCGSGLRAADMPFIPPPGSPAIAGPVSGQPVASSCPTCGGNVSSGKTCQTCGSSWFHKHEKGPYQVNLCPGACFGYFQTQWRKWDDVCPYPYQGIGVSDAPRPPAPALAVPNPKGAGTLPGPRQVEPKGGSDKPISPTIPMPPGGGY